jgi:hypothetical protein
LAEAERLDEQSEADGDFPAAGPRRDVQRLARESGDPVQASCAAAGEERWAPSMIISPPMQAEAFSSIGALSRCCDAERFLRHMNGHINRAEAGLGCHAPDVPTTSNGR